MPLEHPQTPQSPSRTPSSIVDVSQKLNTSPRTTMSLPTPAHSINGSMSSAGFDNSQDSTGYMDESSNKRKRDFEDHGDREQKKVHIEAGRLGIEDLHMDVGEKYLLCRTRHEVVRPHPSQDLFQLYGLGPIAASVARLLPNGQKNVIRKTYKGYMKNLGLSGQFDAVKKDLEDPDTLFAMTVAPDEEWEVHNRRGREIEKGMAELASNSLGRAMTMAKGVVPKELWNSSVLGELAAQDHTSIVKQATSKLPTAASAPAVREPINARTEIPRPKRNIKKRTYGDSSFEGYGEGYVDDDMQEGYSTGDGDERGAGKKRKKTPTAHNFQGPPIRHNSYGPGMVGV
ncbi:Rox3 mediator complex subunit-domain-containing protein [Xylogone sp. PMI_703]|nr:Rox3 mediator complex subunit-domain-containing protein [Xylogone sp. PMI_703]